MVGTKIPHKRKFEEKPVVTVAEILTKSKTHLNSFWRADAAAAAPPQASKWL